MAGAKILRPLATTPYEQFRHSLEKESPRAAYWLESMIYGLLAQVDDMTEDRALELACKIVLHTPTREAVSDGNIHVG
jgi:hypothetical protein